MHFTDIRARPQKRFTVARCGHFLIRLAIVAASLAPRVLVAQPGLPSAPSAQRPRGVPIVVLLETQWGRIDATRSVVRTREEFERLWREAHVNMALPPSPPLVDFSRDMVIVAALGRQPNAGSQVVVARVKEHEHRLEIVIEAHLVPTACDGFATVTYPTTFVRVSASPSTVIFRDRVIQGRC